MLWVGMQEKLGDCVTRHFGDNVVFVDVRHYAKRLLILFELDDKNKLITKEKKREIENSKEKKRKKRKEKEKTGAMQSEQPCAIFLLLLYG